MILKGLNLKTVDPQVLGDVKRLARVPYSTHEESLALCVPVTPSCKPCLLFNLNPFKIHSLNTKFSVICREKTVKPDKNPQQFNSALNTHAKLRNSQDVRPCLLEALNRDLTKPNGHSIRIAVATEYLKNGHSPEEIAELFKSQTDYNYEKSLYYTRDIATRAYKPFKCVTIRELGFCLENCPKRRP